MTSSLYQEKDLDTIYEEFTSSYENNEDVEDEYRNNDRMDDMINRYGRY